MPVPLQRTKRRRREKSEMMRRRIEPQIGTAFEIARGDSLRVIDPVGEQVSDLIALL